MSNMAAAGVMISAIFAGLLLLGWILVGQGQLAKRWKRALAALTVFAVIFWGGPLLIKYDGYNVYVEAVRLLAAVLGAGLYWTGSRD